MAIDTTHFEARDQATPKKRPKAEPKKRGRKPDLHPALFPQESKHISDTSIDGILPCAKNLINERLTRLPIVSSLQYNLII